MLFRLEEKKHALKVQVVAQDIKKHEKTILTS